MDEFFGLDINIPITTKHKTINYPLLWKLAHKIGLATQLSTNKPHSGTAMQVRYKVIYPMFCISKTLFLVKLKNKPFQIFSGHKLWTRRSLWTTYWSPWLLGGQTYPTFQTKSQIYWRYDWNFHGLADRCWCWWGH